MPKVSIIIPLYNAEERIAVTLESVLGQTLRDIEVILVDDGSKDRTVEIAREWERKDGRVHLFLNERNMGVSAARNNGLSHASGEYIRFVDGDDTIPDVSTAEMADIADRLGADVVIGIMRRESIVSAANFGNTVELGKKKKINRYDENLIYTFSVCNKLFRRSVIESHQLRFQPYKHAEDGMFFFQFLQHTDKISGYNEVCYLYNKSEFFEKPSTTENLTAEMMDGILEISEKIRSLDPHAPQEFIDTFNARILGTTLLGEYYRKIWSMEPAAVPVLLDKIRQYWMVLPDDQKSEIVKRNQDLPLTEGLGGTDSLLTHLQFTIAVSDGVSAEHLPRLLQSLYYQRVPSFEVILHPALADAVPAFYRGKDNVHIASYGEDFFDRTLAVCRSTYIAFIQDDLTFTYETMYNAYGRLQDGAEIVSGTLLPYADGRILASDTLEYVFAEFATSKEISSPAHDEMDSLLSNKLFSVLALRRSGISFSKDTAAGLKKALSSCTHGRYRGVRYITSLDDTAVWKDLPLPGVAERLEKYAVHAITGGEKVTEIVPFVKNRLRHRVNRKALFVGEGGELTGAAKKIYERFRGAKEIAPAGMDDWTAAARSSYYSNYRVVFFEHTDAFLRTRILHQGQVCYFLLNQLIRSDAEIEEATAHLEEALREANRRPVKNFRYTWQKASCYLASNKKVRAKSLQVMSRVYRIAPLKKRMVLFAADENGRLGPNQRLVYDMLPSGKKAIVETAGNRLELESVHTLLKMIRQVSLAGHIVLEDAYMPLEEIGPAKGQQISQLWHGAGAFKRFGFDYRELGADPVNGYKEFTKAVVSAPAVRKIYADAFKMPLDSVQATGIPRTDKLKDAAYVERRRQELLQEYPAFDGKKVILFAPTCRTRVGVDVGYDFGSLDAEKLYRALHEDYVFVFKWHPSTYETLRQSNPSMFRDPKYDGFFYDLSAEQDIDTILPAVDILVTDYSSVIFDFSLLNRPVVFFARDLEQYIHDRGFYYETEEYLYGPLVNDTDALIEAIRRGDLCEEKREVFRDTFMSACDGQAAAKTIEYLFRDKLPKEPDAAKAAIPQLAGRDGVIPPVPVQVHVVRDRGAEISVEGVYFLKPGESSCLGLESEAGAFYPAEQIPYPKADVKSRKGELLARAERFIIRIPKTEETEYFLTAEEETGRNRIEATFEGTSGLAARHAPEKALGDIIVSRSGQKLILRRGKLKKPPVIRKKEIGRALLHGRLRTARKKYYERKRRQILDTEQLSETTALVTIRGNHLEENLSVLKDKLAGPVTVFAHRRPFSEKTMTDLYRKLFDSKVVVTDDYMWLYRTNEKPEGQKLVQIWHACGAFKKFGVDGTSMFPGVDALTHQYYDLVSVSSEYIRSVYAKAFDIDIEKVQALGCPRTDILFDEKAKAGMRDKVLASHPELAAKQVILYAPTFRDLPGIPRSRFTPALDFDRLSAALNPDQLFVICPHPVMTAPILKREYPNIREVRDCSTMEMMMAADLLVTDYSSVVFEYSLLGKPVAFYCYDYDDYDRDFYLDYNTDLPGELFKEEQALTDYLKSGQFAADDRQRRFVEKYMGACDGHSAERVAAAVAEMMRS